MQAKRFQAQTLGEAYERVRDTLGDDAVIVSTRNVVGPGLLGLGRREYVEVVAGLPEAHEQQVATVPVDEDLAAHEFVRHVAEATARDGGTPTDAALVAESAEVAVMDIHGELAPPFVNPLAGSARHASEAYGAGDEPAGELATEPARSRLDQIAEDLADLHSLVERTAMDRIETRIDEGPESLREARMRLGEQEVVPAIMLRVLDRVSTALAPDASPEAARQVVLRRLVAELPQPPLIDLTRFPTTIFIVGPAGAGKTTAAVRLALELSAQRGLSVTLAGIDVDRVGAPQELQAYGAATGVPVRLCYTPGELQGLLGEAGSDVVLVDTAGLSGGRRERMAELQAFTRAVRPRTTLLAIPATMRTLDAQRLVAGFRTLSPDGLLLTRCDEIETFGGLLSIACESELGIAYTTHSASVQDPAREGDNHSIAGAVMLGRWSSTPSITAAAAR